MSKPKSFVVGFLSELLGLSSGRLAGKPVAMLTLRLNPKTSFESTTVILDRPSLERLVEDALHLLENSPSLGEAESIDENLSIVSLEKIKLV